MQNKNTKHLSFIILNYLYVVSQLFESYLEPSDSCNMTVKKVTVQQKHIYPCPLLEISCPGVL